jgi:hypothetical protein
LAIYHAPRLEVVGLADYGLRASNWSYEFGRTFLAAFFFDWSIYFIPRSGTRPQGVAG